jgi:hypothetical protein
MKPQLRESNHVTLQKHAHFFFYYYVKYKNMSQYGEKKIAVH